MLSRHRILIPGPVLIGFSEIFDRSYGDPNTPRPYVKVKPANVGGVLLPFECHNCETVCGEAVHPKRRANYYDERGFSWCPACKIRYILDEEGAPLTEEIEVGAMSAPALINDKTISAKQDGLNVLGAVS